jgi:hypothetical protein
MKDDVPLGRGKVQRHMRVGVENPSILFIGRENRDREEKDEKY